MKKKILAISLAVSLVAIAALGATLAYFTDTKDVTNTFTVGNIEIDLWEDVGREADIKAASGLGNVNLGTLLPDSEQIKAPYVENTGDNPAYVRLKVTISDADKFDAMFSAYNGTTPPPAKLMSIYDFIEVPASGWTLAGQTKDTVAKTRTYIFTYNSELAAGASTDSPFTKVMVPEYIDDELVNANITGFSIGIVAEAIQSQNFDDAAAAFAALDAQLS